MDFINPFGKTVGVGGVQPQACVCDTGFASSRGEEHGVTGCIHCGCGCGSKGEYHTGNKQVATTSMHCS